MSTTSTTYLYSLARREHDSDRWHDLVTGATRREFIERLVQDGIERKDAKGFASMLAQSVFAPMEEYKVGDLFERRDFGPHRESYRMRCLAVRPPSATA